MKIKRITRKHHNILIPVYDVIDAQPNKNFIICGNKGSIVAHNCAILDEANFSKAGVKDVTKMKTQVMNTYNTISARIKGTFRQGGEVYGKMFTVSSKKSDSDFIEAHVQSQKASGAGDGLFVCDSPQWEVLPPSMFGDKKFTIAVGNRHMKGFVVSEDQDNEENLAKYVEQGFTILHPPLDMKPEFSADFDIALRDLAGISVPGALSFITQESLNACLTKTRLNPFMMDEVQIGTKDNYTLEEFFKIDNIESDLFNYPWYFHVDLSLNTDRTGISAVCISDRKEVTTADGSIISLPKFSHVFSVALKAPRGDKIPYNKITNFFYWLRRQKVRFQKITRDQFQSEYMAQLLEDQGFNTDKISLDRTPDGYMALRSIIMEERVDMLDCKLLQDELIYLQRDALSGKIDHIVGKCLAPETQILIGNHVTLTIEEMYNRFINGERFQVYCVILPSQDMRICNVKKVFKTMETDTLCKVIFEDGYEVICTPEHKFLLRDNRFVRAEQLNYGFEIVNPICGDYNKSKYTIKSAEQFKTDKRLTVYDIEVESNYNFCLGNGCIVHNSKDVSDSFAGALWTATLDNPGVERPITTTAKIITNVNVPNRYNNRPNSLGSAFANLYKK